VSNRVLSHVPGIVLVGIEIFEPIDEPVEAILRGECHRTHPLGGAEGVRTAGGGGGHHEDALGQGGVLGVRSSESGTPGGA